VNLSEIQDDAVARLRAEPLLSTATVIKDDGSYPATPNREEALQGSGLALVVWDPQPTGDCDYTPDGGGGFYGTNLYVVVEENAKRARSAVSDGGANMTGLEAIERVIKAIAGAGGGANPMNGFRLSSPPFVDFGSENGVRRWVVQFDVAVPFG
jgi:hypothetical protein